MTDLDAILDQFKMVDVPSNAPALTELKELNNSKVEKAKIALLTLIKQQERLARIDELKEVWADDGLYGAIAMYGRVDANQTVMQRIADIEKKAS